MKSDYYRIGDDLMIPAALEGKWNSCLCLEAHATLPRQWQVNCEDATYLNRMGDTISRYRAVSPFGFKSFVARAKEQGYHIVFLDDPEPVFGWYDGLNGDPGVEINSTFPGTFKGLLPFQIQGINFAKDQMANVLQWSTGTGKTVGSSALTRYHSDHDNFDLCLHVVKSHNKVNTQRALKALVDIDASVLTGTPSQRLAVYERAAQDAEDGLHPVLVMHYETFRNDKDAFVALVEGRKLFVIFDEMPTKLKNRKTTLYRAVSEVLYTSSYKTNMGTVVHDPRIGMERPSELRTLMLSATPIENSPEDWFACIRMLDPSIYGSVKRFYEQFVARKNRWHVPVEWKNIDRMGAMAAHITHQVDKRDPDIAKQFPKVMPPETTYVELHKDDQYIYDVLAKEYAKMIEQDESMLRDVEILGAINVLQMICSNPLSALNSSDRFGDYLEGRSQFINENLPGGEELAAWESKNKSGSEVAYKLVDRVGRMRFDDMVGDELRCSKLQALKDHLDSHDGKVIVFTRMNASLLPLISSHMEAWGINHVTYHGGLSEKQKQDRQDTFKSDPNIKVFLSSDSGSDSINLEEADLVLHYDWPWKWSTLEQRQNRCHRITSTHGSVRFITLSVADSVEDRTQELVAMKETYHNQMFKGEIADQALEMRRSDLLYVLTGKRYGDGE